MNLGTASLRCKFYLLYLLYLLYVLYVLYKITGEMCVCNAVSR